MNTIHGHQVASNIEELVNPRRSAVLVIDMQNDFCTPGGHFDRAGKDLTLILEMIPRLHTFLDQTRSAGVPIFHLRQTTLLNGASDSPAWLYLKTRDGKDPDYTLEGSWGHEFVNGLEPLAGEPIVEKHRSSGFVNTTLPFLLRGRGIATVICTGVTTQGCVESTARDAVFFDVSPAVVSDCVATTSRALHEASLIVQSARHDLIAAADLISIWEEKKG